MEHESKLSRFKLYYEAPPRGEELERTILAVVRSIRAGVQKVLPLMPIVRGRRKP